MIPPNIAVLIKKVEDTRDKASAQKNSIQLSHSSWNPLKDARITSYSKFTNALNSLILSFTLGTNLLSVEWWKGVSNGSPPPKEDAEIYIKEFDSFIKIGFVNCIFSSVESSLRIILRAIDSSACSNGTAEFKSIYECLLRNKLSSTPVDSVELLDLFRLIRNTIHNNGVYFHKNNTDQTHLYKGNSYEFKIGQPIELANWDSLLSLTDDLLELLNIILNDSNVTGIAGEILDPFSV